MKSLTLDYLEEVDFVVLAINSHTKGYKLCWEINNISRLRFFIWVAGPGRYLNVFGARF